LDIVRSVFLIFLPFSPGVSTLDTAELFAPMNYFFLACAFFAFICCWPICATTFHPCGFVISSAVSILLVVTYLRAGGEFAFAVVEAGLSQLIYLVLFSYAFFFEGFTDCDHDWRDPDAVRGHANDRRIQWTEEFARRIA